MARVYATPDDLAGWLGSYPPVNAAVLLTRASLVVDELLVGVCYAVDDDSLPTDQSVIDALRGAVCAQVAWWLECERQAAAAAAAMAGGCQGDQRLNQVVRPLETVDMPAIAPDTLRVLHVAGLHPAHPWVFG